MKRILSMELKKAFWNKRFLFSLSVALFLSLLSGFLQIRGYIIRTRFLNTPAYQNVADWGKDYHLSAETMADFWIGMDFSTWCATAFFFLLPLLAVLPYGSSLHREYKSGYLRQHRTIAEASAVESPIRQETIGFPAHFFARAHNFKPPGRACQPEADSPMRT